MSNLTSDNSTRELQILIIDDDPSFRKLLGLRLQSFIDNLKITTFENLSEAREALKEEKVVYYDLVILDQHLPDGSGTEFLDEGWFEELAVMTISSDTDPSIPGASIKAGSAYFLNKLQIKEDLFKHLVLGIMDRNILQKQLNDSKVNAAVIDTVRTLVSTLKHEINNPLGAVLGGAFIMRSNEGATQKQIEAAELVEKSGKRIKEVLDELCDAVELKPVLKAETKVFSLEGDEGWEDPDNKTDKEG